MSKIWTSVAVVGCVTAAVLGAAACGSSGDLPATSADGGKDAGKSDGRAGDGAACGANLQTDARNCGACGHDCGDATCVGGYCQPVSVSTGIEGTENVTCFAVDETTIYYSFKSNVGATSIRKVPIAGGAPTTLAEGESGCPMLATGGSVYWVVRPGSTVKSVPIAGGATTTVASGIDAIQARHLTSDGTSIYWVVEDPTTLSQPTEHNLVKKLPLSGGTATTLVAGSTGEGNSQWSLTTVYGQDLYFFDGVDVKRVPLAGGTPVLLAKSVEYATGLAVDANGVYWARERYYLYKVPLTGGVPREFAAAGITLDMIADATFAYYCDTDGVKVSPLAGQIAAPRIVDKRGNPNPCAVGLEQNGSFLFWADGDALIHRLAK